ncbi:Inner membrane ABC transporter permease protein ydcU [Raoultella planticola]|uniref:Inner membrane ABC transporter permease protein ydcU n=1 Tax=Raoultella planticola TaxID=575 RepID=A0A485AJC3_RAOPL|nr:Inner membrane ABC transporter permease protein ydcU [Raoultella planticola]
MPNLKALFNPANYDIIVRTLVMALSVTIASAVLALPMSWYMARYTRGKMKAFFYIAVMLPMWASYIVKAYAWTLLLAKDGVAQWFLGHLGLEGVLNLVLTIPAVGGNTLSTSGLGRFLVFVYIWLPFMILPVQAALERLPPSLLQASADLGARPRQTFRHVVLPLAIPWHCRRVDFYLLPDAGGLYRSAAGGGRPASLLAIWSIPSRGRSATCRWQPHLPWYRLC